MDYRTPYTINRAKMYEGRTPMGEGLMALLALTKEESSFVDNIARDFLQTFFSVVAKEIVLNVDLVFFLGPLMPIKQNTLHFCNVWSTVVMGRTVFDVQCLFVRRQNLVLEFDFQEMNTFNVRSMFEVLFDKHLVNIKLPKRMLFYVGIQHFFATFENF